MISKSMASRRLDLAAGLSIEDEGDAFFIILGENAFEVIVSLDDGLASRLAAFIQARLRQHR